MPQMNVEMNRQQTSRQRIIVDTDTEFIKSLLTWLTDKIVIMTKIYLLCFIYISSWIATDERKIYHNRISLHC